VEDAVGVEIEVLNTVVPQEPLEEVACWESQPVCWGVTRKIRMATLTRVRVLNTFKYKVRAQRDCDSLCK
jgi:hypothetical protein